MNRINQYIEAYGSKKVFFIMTAVLIVIGILVSILVNVSQKTFTVEGTRFTYKEWHNNLWTFEDENNELLTAHSKYYQRPLGYYLDDIIIEYKGDTIRRIGDSDTQGYSIYLNDQRIYEGDFFEVEVDDDSSEVKKEKEPFEVVLFKKTLKTSDYVQSSAFSGMLLLNFILIPLGVSQITFTETYWHFKHFLDVEGGKPSEFYILMTQWGGALLIFIGIFLPLLLALGLFTQ